MRNPCSVSNIKRSNFQSKLARLRYTVKGPVAGKSGIKLVSTCVMLHCIYKKQKKNVVLVLYTSRCACKMAYLICLHLVFITLKWSTSATQVDEAIVQLNNRFLCNVMRQKSPKQLKINYCTGCRAIVVRTKFSLQLGSHCDTAKNLCTYIYKLQFSVH